MATVTVSPDQDLREQLYPDNAFTDDNVFVANQPAHIAGPFDEDDSTSKGKEKAGKEEEEEEEEDLKPPTFKSEIMTLLKFAGPISIATLFR